MADMRKSMQWQAINFDWNRARAFLVTAEEGSLTAAAQALGTTQPTLGRQVSALEDELGVVLFDRVAGKLVLTDAGRTLLQHVHSMADAAAHLTRLADGQSTRIQGRITLSASEVYCAFLLPPIIEQLRQLHPGITVEILADNTPSDLSRREADIAIRNFRPTQSDLIARKLRDDTARLYATPAYLASIGNPQKPEHFNSATFIEFADSAALIEWLNGTGMSLTGENFPLISHNYLVHWELVKRGLGIGIMPDTIGDAEPKVQRACPTLAPFEFPVWLVSHRELKTSRRVRIVFDLLADALS